MWEGVVWDGGCVGVRCVGVKVCGVRCEWKEEVIDLENL